MNPKRLGFAMAFIAIAASASTAAAADDPMLKRLVGAWVGNGQFRWDSVTDPERLYCRISGVFMPDGVLHQAGRCALSVDSAGLSFDIRAGTGGSYSGTATAGPRSPVPFSGTGKSNRLVLVAPDANGSPATTTIDLVSGGFHVVAERIDPKTGKKYVVGDVTFVPEEP
jgi:hypothetical protein